MCRSHIIPEFMYDNIYDENPKRYYAVKNEPGETSGRIEQKGFREHLLCKACESKLSKFEKYAEENLYGKNLVAKATITNGSMSPDGNHIVFDIVGLDYNKMKLFLDSLLWRLFISRKFPTADMDLKTMEILRLSILNEEALEEETFPCIIRTFFIPKREGRVFLKNYQYYPVDVNLKDTGILQIIIDGLEFNFFYGYELPKSDKVGYLTKEGKSKIFATSITERRDLLSDMNRTFDYLEKRFGKKD